MTVREDTQALAEILKTQLTAFFPIDPRQDKNNIVLAMTHVIIETLEVLHWAKEQPADTAPDPDAGSAAELTIRYIEGLAKKDLHPAELKRLQDQRAGAIKTAEQDFQDEIAEINRKYILLMLRVTEDARNKRQNA